MRLAIALALMFAAPVSLVAKTKDWTFLTGHRQVQSELALLNAYRESQGLKPLELDQEMTVFAWEHAKQQIAACQFCHSSGPYAEIICASQTSAWDAIHTWINSPGHQGIMVGNYTKCGCAYYADAKTGATFWIITFR